MHKSLIFCERDFSFDDKYNIVLVNLFLLIWFCWGKTSSTCCWKFPSLICISHNLPKELEPFGKKRKFHNIQGVLSWGLVWKIMLSCTLSFWHTHSTIFILPFIEMHPSQRHYIFFTSFLMRCLLFSCVADKFYQPLFTVWGSSTKCF